MSINPNELTPFMLDLQSRFNNWKSWSKQEWRDDSCGETLEEFNERMTACEEDLFADPYGWAEILENFKESDF